MPSHLVIVDNFSEFIYLLNIIVSSVLDCLNIFSAKKKRQVKDFTVSKRLLFEDITSVIVIITIK